MKFDPESYTIIIRKEEFDGEILYVGRVAEFPNISSFEDTFEEARNLVIDAIQTLKKIADKTSADFPIPYPTLSDDYSGRVTLRLPKSLHAKVARIAEQEDISINQFLITAVASHVGEIDGISKVVSEAVNRIGDAVNSVMTSVVNVWNSGQFMGETVTPTSASRRLNMGGLQVGLVHTLGSTYAPVLTRGNK